MIVCNNTTAAPIAMGAGSDGDEVTIPSVMMSLANCNAIKDYLDSGVNLTLSGGLIDGDYDNGVITHEYGHGISVRLTGGPATSSCLNNDEQMGEGWSDFFGLAAQSLRIGQLQRDVQPQEHVLRLRDHHVGGGNLPRCLVLPTVR